MSAIDIQHALLGSVLKTDPPLVGPFAVLLDRESTSPYRNYAAPRTSALPSRDELDELVALFAARGLPARLEYVEHDPHLTDALTAAGFTVVQRIPLLTLGTLVAPPPVPGVAIAVARNEGGLVGAAAVMGLAYDDDEPIERSTARLGRTIDGGGAVIIAQHEESEQVIGAGLHTSAVAGRVEIAAVATHPDFRRRGVASNVGAALARHAVDMGTAPFLQAEGDAEARMYERIGFERIASMVFAAGPPIN
jgi:GNAT superfamily N-acetyltransferase